jgi:hypothetical protein
MQVSNDPQFALLAAMLATSAADNAIDDEELARIGQIVRTMPVFRGFDPRRLPEMAAEIAELLGETDGLDRLLDLIATALPERLHETAYALAVEIAATNLDLPQEARRLLAMLRDRLDLDALAVAAIQHSARVRYRAA